MSHSLLAHLAVAASLVVAACSDGSPTDPRLAAVAPSLSSAHLKGGPSAKPGFTDLGLRLAAAAAVSGLGNVDLVANLTATGNPTAICTNPAGATQPPGQNPAPVTLTGTQAIPASDVKNGTVAIAVTTAAPVSPVAGAPGCPNTRWTETITDVSFTSGTLAIDQPTGTVVLTVACTFSPGTGNGAVSAATVTCTVP